MGFALWIDGEIACAQGTHEYRPMGVALVSTSDLFSPRDFSPGGKIRSRAQRSFVGLFASLGQVNGYLRKLRSHGKEKKSRASAGRQLSII